MSNTNIGPRGIERCGNDEAGATQWDLRTRCLQIREPMGGGSSGMIRTVLWRTKAMVAGKDMKDVHVIGILRFCIIKVFPLPSGPAARRFLIHTVKKGCGKEPRKQGAYYFS